MWCDSSLSLPNSHNKNQRRQQGEQVATACGRNETTRTWRGRSQQHTVRVPDGGWKIHSRSLEAHFRVSTGRRVLPWHATAAFTRRGHGNAFKTRDTSCNKDCCRRAPLWCRAVVAAPPPAPEQLVRSALPRRPKNRRAGVNCNDAESLTPCPPATSRPVSRRSATGPCGS